MACLKRRLQGYVKNPRAFFATFLDGGDISALCLPDQRYVPMIANNYGDWTDDLAVRVGCEVLYLCTGYPVETVRRRLYKTWLSAFVAQEWSETFDHLLLECVVATPSPSNPAKPLFSDLFRLAAISSYREGTYLETSSVERLFINVGPDDNDFRSASGLVGHLGILLSIDDPKALYEAGLIIGFLSLLLSSLCAVNANRLTALFRELETTGLASIFPTSFAGELPCPGMTNLEKLRARAATRQGVLRPWVSGLALAQYTIYLRAGDNAPRKDAFFLEQAFMARAKYSGLETVGLLEMFAKKTRLPMDYLNRMMGGRDTSTWTRKLMEFYMANVATPGNVQMSAPWCRTVDSTFFRGLGIPEGRGYALKIIFVLGRHARSVQCKRWSDLVYEAMPDADVEYARAWAERFRALLDRGLLRPLEVDAAGAAN